MFAGDVILTLACVSFSAVAAHDEAMSCRSQNSVRGACSNPAFVGRQACAVDGSSFAGDAGHSHVLSHLSADVQMRRRQCVTLTAYSAMTGQLNSPLSSVALPVLAAIPRRSHCSSCLSSSL